MTTALHFSETELNAGLPEILRSPSNGGVVVQITARPDKELRELRERSEVTPQEGLPGDRWARHCSRKLPDGSLNPDTQLTLMNSRAAALVAGEKERWPLAGDNLLVDLDLSESNLPAGQRLKLGGAILEITAQPHTGCAKFSSRFGVGALKFVNSPEGKKLRLRGIHARVVQAGAIAVGDRIEKV
jgi:MOSC domain-containing protein YiiM